MVGCLLVAIAIALEDGSMQKEKDLAELRSPGRGGKPKNNPPKGNGGKGSCWKNCGKKAGPCPSFCGQDKYCCKKKVKENGCNGKNGSKNYYKCVPKPLPAKPGDRCFQKCHDKAGPCPDFCGDEKYCCKKGQVGEGCDGSMGSSTKKYTCVPKPVKQEVTTTEDP